mmetsp:Transcript_13350/g.13417  ORF Transcript_13350/g.13417 Transcript_13350/m.13417 type:complete len:306 (-) Transcript_13350:100-1017(-)
MGATSGMSVVERSQYHMEEKQRKIEMLRMQLQQAEEQELSFQPKILGRPSSRGRLRSSFSNMCDDEVQRERERDAEIGEEDTRPVYERLASAEKERQRRLAVLRDKAEMESAQSLTFHPHIHSDDHSPHRVKEKDGPDIFERLSSQTTEVMKGHVGDLEPKLDPEATFKPAVRRKSFSSGTGRVKEPGHDVFDRLINAATHQTRGEIEKRLNDEYSYKPKINATSRSLSATRRRSNSAQVPIHERLYQQNEQKKKSHEKFEKEKERIELEGCTFSPTLPDDTHHMAGSADSKREREREREKTIHN